MSYYLSELQSTQTVLGSQIFQITVMRESILHFMVIMVSHAE